MNKVASKAKERFNDVKEFVGDAKTPNDILGKVTGSLGNNLSGMDLGPTVKSIQEKGSQCQVVARETIDLCETTKTKGDQMIAFGSDIQKTLQGFGKTVDASALETIKDLTDGNKLKSAMELAKGLDQIAVQCIDKSVQMIDLMEGAMDDLPDALEKMIDQAAEHQGKNDTHEEALMSLNTLDKDIEDVKSCMNAMESLNIATAFTVGLRAFEQLSSKAKQSRSMFESIQGFAKDVEQITVDFTKMDVVSLASHVKEILRCIRLLDVMRKFAEGTKKIIQVIIDLFKSMSSRISTLWSALAFAKQCMADCVEYVKQATALCLEAHDKSKSLIDKSLSIKGQLESVGGMNAQTVGAVRELSQGNEIREAIDLATGMDNLVMDCTAKVTSMVDRVSEGFQKLPPIITNGIDMKEAGKRDQDPQPADVEKDISDLEESRQAIESAHILKACSAGMHGFSSVSQKAGVSKDMLELVESFSSDCSKTIESFMGVWDLESAMDKIKEMCRLVSLGELMKQFASQIKRLVVAIIALMQAAIKKFSSLNLKDLGLNDIASVANVGSISEGVNKVTDKLGGIVGDDAVNKMKEGFGKLWK